LPFRDLPNAYVEDWIESLKAVEAMDFDIFASGHTALAKKADVPAVRAYLEDLRAQVLALVRQGKSLDEIKAAVTMDKYKSWGQYQAFLPLNIEGMVRHLRLYRR